MNKKDITRQNPIYERIRNIIEDARSHALYAVNTEMVQAYWLIGKEIVEEEQKGKKRAEYGKALINDLSTRLTVEFGKGFTIANIWNMRQFYLTYPKLYAVRRELTWTHYRLLMRVENTQARSFYEIECVKNHWATRELERQINSLLFERLTLSKDKKGLLRLAKRGQEIQKADDLIKDPYILEFVGLKEEPRIREINLENALIEHLKEFIEIRQKEENPPIGIVLCADKNEAVVRYTLPKGEKRIFASKYKLYLPTKEELEAELKKERFLLEQNKRLGQ